MGMRVQPTISDFAYSRYSQIAKQRGTKPTEEIALVLEWYARSSDFSEQLKLGGELKFESSLSIEEQPNEPNRS
jgi:hypothetical protein